MSPSIAILLFIAALILKRLILNARDNSQPTETEQGHRRYWK